MILTTGPAYTPPAERDALAKERSRLTGISLEPQNAGDYDVVVVGAGTAGCCAAIASARLGAKTLLIQDRPVLGGNASIELGVPPQGASASKPNAREGGIMEEALRITSRRLPHDQRRLPELAARPTNLTVMLNERVIAVDMAAPGPNRRRPTVNTLVRPPPPGPGISSSIAPAMAGSVYAGAEYRLGRESARRPARSSPRKSRQGHHERLHHGPHSTFFNTENRGKPTPLHPRLGRQAPAARGVRPQDQVATGGNWWLEHEGTIDDLNDPEQARDELIRITFGYWDFIKNVWEETNCSANFELVHVPIWNASEQDQTVTK